MSLDLDLILPECKHCGRDGENVGDFNYTYNVSPVWYKIYPQDKGMVYIEGMTGEESVQKLTYAINQMELRKEELRQHVRGSGKWGTVEGFIKFLCEVRACAEKHPQGIWSAGR